MGGNCKPGNNLKIIFIYIKIIVDFFKILFMEAITFIIWICIGVKGYIAITNAIIIYKKSEFTSLWEFLW